MTWGAHFLDALDSEGHVKPDRRRDVALVLAAHATQDGRGRDVGDPVHEEVTEGRRKANEERRARGSPEVAYSSCGDLPHWMLDRLGCTDERLVNRTDDGGQTPWKIGANLTRIVNAPGFVRAGGRRTPQPGDVLFLMNRFGGHVCVLVSWSSTHCTTDDYGQPYARRRTHPVVADGEGYRVGGAPLVGWLDLDGVPFEGPAKLPEAVEAKL